MIKSQDKVELWYPENSGFAKSDINFFIGKPDLVSFFFPSQENECRLFVTDKTIAALPSVKQFIDYVNNKKDSKNVILELEAGESAKTIQSVLNIVKTALDNNFTRQALFVGIGGGVICDMTGFAASIFKRGVKVQFVPTTLLADVDASIGGKTGCDFENYKNMIGAFYPAQSVNIWSDFIQSLPEKEFISGLGEAIKTAFLFSPEMCKLFKTQKEKIMNRDKDLLFSIIKECAKAKASIVHTDFKEMAERAYLNYGHTFGHALETIAGLGKVTHGEGVAWGIGRALDLATQIGACKKEFADKNKQLLMSYGYDTNPIPEVLKDKHTVTEIQEKLLAAMKKDKKNFSTSKVRVTLQKDYCNTFMQEVSDNEILAVLK
ncbi:MAG: 3-dehydroquinate synthase [Treponema sp.]|nr:3-dehydroquinate synthase [Treponema sp.]